MWNFILWGDELRESDSQAIPKEESALFPKNIFAGHLLLLSFADLWREFTKQSSCTTYTPEKINFPIFKVPSRYLVWMDLYASWDLWMQRLGRLIFWSTNLHRFQCCMWIAFSYIATRETFNWQYWVGLSFSLLLVRRQTVVYVGATKQKIIVQAVKISQWFQDSDQSPEDYNK